MKVIKVPVIVVRYRLIAIPCKDNPEHQSISTRIRHTYWYVAMARGHKKAHNRTFPSGKKGNLPGRLHHSVPNVVVCFIYFILLLLPTHIVHQWNHNNTYWYASP